MPNDPYLDASVAWRIKTGNIEFREADYRTTLDSIISSGLATEVNGLISSGKEADVYLARYRGGQIAVKVYRLYRTSHRGGRPIKLDSAGWLAAHEFEMQLQAWKGGARVPTPARRVENMFSMRYLGGDNGAAPRLHDLELERPELFLKETLFEIEQLATAGVVHSDLSDYNILVHEERPWLIDFSEAIRVDRTGYSAWQRLNMAKRALENGLDALQRYFGRYHLNIEKDELVRKIIIPLDKNGAMDM